MIDIIIPLYNGYSFFRNCFESILKNTHDGDFRIIIINDCSKEEKLLGYLNKIEKNKYRNVVILKNKKNSGFIKSVNRGMEYGDKNDVILLNSDTVVTRNWLKKMKACAYSRHNIATVTPITNNGALVSFPEQWKDNELDPEISLEDMSRFVEKSSLKLYPEIPSPVGFCMYIKRKVIEKVGFFDEKYGKGYGEENDFGMRAYRLGYKHVLDDSTFILHLGSMTFKNIAEEKKELIEKNTKILHGKYPELNGLLLDFNDRKPLKTIFDNIKINIETDFFSKPGILFVSVDEPEFLTTGATLHIQNLILNTGNNFNKYLLYRDKNDLVLVLYLKNKKKIRYNFNFFENFNFTMINHTEIEFLWELILKNFNIDIIHFQTPQNLPLSLFSLSKKLGKKVFFTVHDFLLYCPSFILTKYDKNKNIHSFCNYEKKETICKQCLAKKTGIEYDEHRFQEKRRNYISENVIPSIDTFFFPSRFIKNETQKLYPEIAENKSFVIEHGINKPNINNKKIKNSKKTINIAFLGLFSVEKGSKIFLSIVKKFSKEKQLKFFIVGEIGNKKILPSLEKLENLKVIGKYKNRNLSSLLVKENIDMVMNLSVCPETFSLTVSEAWANKLPVLVLNIGAQADRVTKTNAGWVVDYDDPEKEICNVIENIMENKSLLAKKIKNIPVIKSEKNNAKEYDIFYEKNISKPLKKEKPNQSESSKRMFRFMEEIKIEKLVNKDKKIFDLNNNIFKHWSFLFCEKVGITEKIRPFYYKRKEKINKLVNKIIRSFSS